MRSPLSTILFQIPCLISTVALAYGAELPDEARQLLEKRTEAVKAIDHRFVEELEKLKVAHTKRGKLDSANAIVALIAQYRVDQDGLKDPQAQIARLKGLWKRDYDGSLFEFDADGGGVWGARDKFRVTYVQKMDHFELTRPQWNLNTIKFAATGDTLIGTVKGGPSYKLTRIDGPSK